MNAFSYIITTFYNQKCKECRMAQAHAQIHTCKIDNSFLYCPLNGERLAWTNRYIGMDLNA